MSVGFQQRTTSGSGGPRPARSRIRNWRVMKDQLFREEQAANGGRATVLPIEALQLSICTAISGRHKVPVAGSII
jgi:hypothetical protein